MNMKMDDKESIMSTECLDDALSSIQLLGETEPDAKKDNVLIPRAELKIIVEHTLAAQTKCNYFIEQLKEFKRQNEGLMETIIEQQCQANKNKREHCSMPPHSKSNSQVFRFDRYSLPQISLSPVQNPDIQNVNADKAEVTLAAHTGVRYASSAGKHSSSQVNSGGSNFPDDSKKKQNDALQGNGPPEADPRETLEMDSDSSLGVQPMSRDVDSVDGPSVDGPSDSDHSSLTPTRQQPPGDRWPTSPTASHNAPFQLNIPNPCLLEGAREYSGSFLEEEPVVAKTKVSHSSKQCALMETELEKTKLFIHRISSEGGVNPENLNELFSLRDKVEKLQDENCKLKIELQNSPSPFPKKDCSMCQQLMEREKIYLGIIKKLEAVNSGFLQPSSSVGPPALPTIASSSMRSVVRKHVAAQTDRQGDEGLNDRLQRERAAVAEQFQSELEDLRRQLFQAQTSEKQHQKITQKSNLDLASAIADNCRLNQQLVDLHQRLQNETIHLNGLIKQLAEKGEDHKRLLAKEMERSKELERMIEDERRRFKRGEDDLLKRVGKDLQDITALEELVLKVDTARRNSTALPEGCEEQLSLIVRSKSRGNDAPHTNFQ